MARVVANLAMSVDGFVADEGDGCDELFGWYVDGTVPVRLAGGLELRMSPTSAQIFTETLEGTGAYVVGRRLYDLTNGWDARPPSLAPMFVVTHEPPGTWPRDGVPITFVTDLAEAVRRAADAAGDRLVSVAGATVARECLELGLLDEIVVNLVPVVLGRGIPWFAGARLVVRLEDPEVVPAEGVTHLHYVVRREAA